MESKSNNPMESQFLYDNYTAAIGPKVISIILISQSAHQAAVGLIGTLKYIYYTTILYLYCTTTCLNTLFVFYCILLGTSTINMTGSSLSHLDSSTTSYSMAVSRVDDLAGDICCNHEDRNNSSMSISPSALFDLKLNSYSNMTNQNENSLDVYLDDPLFVNTLPSTLSVVTFLKSIGYTGLVFFVESITKIE